MSRPKTRSPSQTAPDRWPPRARLCRTSLPATFPELPADQVDRLGGLRRSIADAVPQLQPRHARNALLLDRSAELAGQTVLFLQRVASPPSPSYGAKGRRAPQQSML